jgi:heme-degrading monooxygenase HmoA
MVYERAQLYITAGSEAAFEAAMSESIGLLQRAAGCQGAELARGVEEPSTYLLLVQWGAVEDHDAFKKTDEYKAFGGAIAPHFAKPPEVLHFTTGRRL